MVWGLVIGLLMRMIIELKDPILDIDVVMYSLKELHSFPSCGNLSCRTRVMKKKTCFGFISSFWCSSVHTRVHLHACGIAVARRHTQLFVSGAQKIVLLLRFILLMIGIDGNRK